LNRSHEKTQNQKAAQRSGEGEGKITRVSIEGKAGRLGQGNEENTRKIRERRINREMK